MDKQIKINDINSNNLLTENCYCTIDLEEMKLRMDSRLCTLRDNNCIPNNIFCAHISLDNAKTRN